MMLPVILFVYKSKYRTYAENISTVANVLNVKECSKLKREPPQSVFEHYI
jgi:hypothetical protein